MGFTHVQSIHGLKRAHSLGLTQVPRPNVSIGTGVWTEEQHGGVMGKGSKGGGGGWKRGGVRGKMERGDSGLRH